MRSPDASTCSAARCCARVLPFLAYVWSYTKHWIAELVANSGGGRTRIISLSSAIVVGLERSERSLRPDLQSFDGSRRSRHETERAQTEKVCHCWLACRSAALAILSSRINSS